MRVNRIFAGILAIPMMISLAACGDDDNDGGSHSKKKKSSSSYVSSDNKAGKDVIEKEATSPSSTEPVTEPPTELPTEPQAKDFWTEYGAGSDAYISSADSFHDNMAWVTLTGGEKIKTYAINKDGEVKYTIDFDDTESKRGGWSSYNTHTFFDKGCAIVSTDTKQLLINTEGETLWDADKDGMEYGAKRWGEEGVKSIVIGNQCDGNAMDKEDALGDCLYKKNMAFEGYALVQYDIDTFEYTGKAFGFLAPDGTWMLEPIETGWTMKYFVGNCYGVYDNKSNDYNNSMTYVNIETGETVNGNYQLPDKVKAWQREYNCKAQDGLDFDVEKKAFVDASGNVAIDCSQYTFTAEIYGKFDASNSHYIPAFHDGYAVLAVLNDDKSPFFFAIDKKGNKQFEPKRFPDNFSTFEEVMSFYISEDVMTYGSYTIGARFWYTEGWGSGENGEAKYLDHTGKEIGKLNDMNINFLAPFSDGVAAVSVFTNSDRNLSEYRYIDHDGNDLFPKH